MKVDDKYLEQLTFWDKLEQSERDIVRVCHERFNALHNILGDPAPRQGKWAVHDVVKAEFRAVRKIYMYLRTNEA